MQRPIHLNRWLVVTMVLVLTLSTLAAVGTLITGRPIALATGSVQAPTALYNLYHPVFLKNKLILLGQMTLSTRADGTTCNVPPGGACGGMMPCYSTSQSAVDTAYPECLAPAANTSPDSAIAQAPPAVVARTPALAAANVVTFTVLHTNDFHGQPGSHWQQPRHRTRRLHHQRCDTPQRRRCKRRAA